MFLPNDAPLPQNSLDPPCPSKVRRSNCRIAADRLASTTGRTAAFVTVPTIGSLHAAGGYNLAADGAKLLQQTSVARASALTTGVPDLAESKLPTRTAPTVIPLNAAQYHLESCEPAQRTELAQPLRPAMLMPERFTGFAGLAPRWGDANMNAAPVFGPDGSLLGWIRENPLLSLVIAGAGVFALTRKKRGGR